MSAIAELPALVTDEQLVELTGISKATLQNWRNTRLRGPAWIKLGKAVRYPRESVLQWMAENTVTPAGSAAR